MIVDLGFKPYSHQREAHSKRKRFSVLVWHRGAGKTVFASLELVLAAAVLKDGLFAFIAPLLKQAKKAAWDCLRAHALRIPGAAIHEGDLSITLPSGARVMLLGADNPDALRGVHLDGAVMDEVADMKPQVWGEIVLPALQRKGGWALFIGTPKGINLFSELYFNAPKKGDDWWADFQPVSKTGLLSEEQIAAAKREQTPQQFAQEYECDFSASSENVLIPLEDTIAAVNRKLPSAAYQHAARVMGIDVAWYGGDRSVIARRQGLAVPDFKSFRGIGVLDFAGQIALAAMEWKPHAVFIDVTGGMGAGVLERLRELGYAAIGIHFGAAAGADRYENKRAEMWALMAQWLKQGSIPDDSELRAELSSVTYTHANVRGRLQLDSKDDMKKRGMPSPDKADALALTFAHPVAAPDDMVSLHARVQQFAQTDFDPYKHMLGEEQP